MSRYLRRGVIEKGRVGHFTSSTASSDTRFTGGLGFRYLITRKMRLASGIDVARGPEDLVICFQVGIGL
jgi:hypothetical protein